MQTIIKGITEKLKNGSMSADEANKKLIDLFTLVKGNTLSKIKCFIFGALLSPVICGLIYSFWKFVLIVNFF
jgi:hypothetical protein